jgi:hypothetical protein
MLHADTLNQAVSAFFPYVFAVHFCRIIWLCSDVMTASLNKFQVYLRSLRMVRGQVSRPSRMKDKQ